MKKFRDFLIKLATLDGSEHNIALGVATGIFIAVTPTIPFHTVFAVALAVILRGSKRAAIISVWFSNPLTIPIFYAGSYYAGTLLMGIEHSNIQLIYDLLKTLQSDININAKMDAIIIFFKAELPVFYAMLIGGAVLGIMPAIGSYFLTKSWVRKFRNKGKNDSTV